MIGLMYFPSFIPVFTVHFGDQLHLISICWVINQGGVHLQTLQASWVTFPHASDSTGCIFTIFTMLPGWVPAAHLGTLVVRKMDSCPCASVVAQGRTGRGLTTGHSCCGHGQAPRPPCGSATVAASCSQWRTEKSPFQKTPRPGLWEGWGGCL